MVTSTLWRWQLAFPEEGAALLELQVQNLTRRVGEGDERYSLLEEQNHSLKNQLLSDITQHQEKENMYKQNVRPLAKQLLEHLSMQVTVTAM